MESVTSRSEGETSFMVCHAALEAAQAENTVLAERLAELSCQLAHWQEAEQRELELLRAPTLTLLLERLIHGLKSAYQLQSVRLILNDPQHELRHLLASDGVQLGEIEGVQLVDALSAVCPQLASLGASPLWHGRYTHAEHAGLVPPGQCGSLSLIPVRSGPDVAGVLVFTSADPMRFGAPPPGDALAHLGQVAAVCTENAVSRARLLHSGLTDFLTGFHNRRYLHSRLREELARSQRAGETLVCLMIDIDHFKRINDDHGHLAGDEVLREVARRIEGEMRLSDCGARFGGDEFAIMLSNSSLADGERVAARVREAVGGHPVIVGARAARVTLSIGLAGAAVPDPGPQDYRRLSERLLAAADEALYQAKSDGRDRVAVRAALVR
jgi:diguanylate cyclase (GGDEF)-like protein